jgi:hypothetical protein
MSLRQTISDAVLLIKQDRKWQVITIVVIGFVIWGIVGQKPRQNYEPLVEEVPVGSGSMGGEEAYRDLVTGLNQEVKSINEQVLKNQEMQQGIKQDIEKFEESTAKIFKKMIERIADIEGKQSQLENNVRTPEVVEPENVGDIPDDTLIPFGDLDEEEPQEVEDVQPQKTAVIGAGDSVRIKLLAGVNAPTDGTPYPVVFKLIGDVSGPDSSSLPLGEARLIAAAQGSLTDSRALFRITSLNIRYPDGSRKIIEVDGWVVGEDGIRGMEGVLIDPLGKILMGAAISGVVQGYGQGLSAGQVAITNTAQGGVFSQIDGSTSEFALGRGIGTAGQSWSKHIDKRAEQLVPQVKVLSGRTATAVFSKTVEIPGLYDAITQEEFVFASLD